MKLFSPSCPLALLCSGAVLAGLLVWSHATAPRLVPAEQLPAPVIYIQVEGQVASPGVVELPAGATVADALRACGGVLPDGEAPDGSAPLRSGSHLYVPLAGQAPRWDLNTVTEAELLTVEGVSKKAAANIVAYREQYGSFLSPEELLLVEGVGEKTYEKLRPHIGVAPGQPVGQEE